MQLRATLLGCLLATAAYAVELNPLFQDNAVLQCDARVPVWGTAENGEKITVKFADQSVSTVGAGGVWKVWLNPMRPSATPRVLTVHGNTTREIANILVGEVWIASGQSNMERRLGLAGGQQPILNWEQAVATANHPEIREFHVQHKRALAPRETVEGGAWTVCSPGTVENFSAVGYFFARDLLAARKVPVGIIHSSVGGTPAEAWTSEAGLKPFPEFADALADVKSFAADPEMESRRAQSVQLAWFEKTDPSSKPGAAWSAADFSTKEWASMTLPSYLERGGFPGFDGIIWFRREFTLPENWDGSDVQVHLGAIDDMDTTWVNGERVGMTAVWNKDRVYPVPGRLLKRGINSIAVRVLDVSGNGGLYGGKDEMRVEINTRDGKASLPLSGAWHCKTSLTMAEIRWLPGGFFENGGLATGLYNGMISPLVPYALRGVIWYQGENNVGRERQYRTLFPVMIADWRRAWGQGDFPFLFVQIAPFVALTPELREAQLLASQHVKNTAMVVTADCGDANDIHPANKPPVGARLALAARALAYGERIEYSGPVFDSLKIEGANAVLRFTHLGGGLVAKDGELKGFTVAGADKVFHPAQARISGDTVFVRSAEVSRPVAVRYGWANVPDVNLFNRAGLPASPFRTDVD